MKIYESGEMYLETILILQEKLAKVRSIDIANHLSYSKPSISRAMNILKKAHLINIDNDGTITLTTEGLNKANTIFERHQIITKFLINHLGVSATNAEMDACRIEHIISNETFAKIKQLIGE